MPNLELSNSQRKSIYTTSKTGVKYIYIFSISFIKTLSVVRLQHLQGFQLGKRLNNEEDAFLLSCSIWPNHILIILKLKVYLYLLHNEKKKIESGRGGRHSVGMEPISTTTIKSGLLQFSFSVGRAAKDQLLHTKISQRIISWEAK